MKRAKVPAEGVSTSPLKGAPASGAVPEAGRPGHVRRWLLGLAIIVIFCLTFVPVPIEL